MAHEQILKLKLTRATIDAMVKEVPVIFRPLAHQFIELCKAYNTPLLVYSAGMYDLIYSILSQHSLLSPNLEIISNKLSFNSQGISDSFSGPLIHTFSKGQKSVVDDYPIKIEGRPNMVTKVCNNIAYLFP